MYKGIACRCGTGYTEMTVLTLYLVPHLQVAAYSTLAYTSLKSSQAEGSV